MAVLAAVGERETRGIRKSHRRPVDHFGNQSKRLQRARAQLFQQQQRCEIAQIALVSDRQNRAQPLEIDILGTYVVMRRHRQAQITNRDFGRLVADLEQSGLRRTRRRIHQIHDFALVRARDRRVRLTSKIAHGRRMPVITSC